MKIIRWILGKLILLGEKLFSSKGVQRSPEDQMKVEHQTSQLSLYQFEACPFCVKVRFAMKRLNLPIETRDAKKNPQFKQELLEQGGQLMVPCLKIEKPDSPAQWMYESAEIISYLEKRFTQ
jgi:glutaredoxin